MPIKDIEVGTVSGKLTVTNIYRGPKQWMVEVNCECGNVKQIAKNNFASGKTTTCGCGPRGKPFPKEHGQGGTLAYNSWKKMMQRCYDPLNKDYYCYGGRGITVIDRWHSVSNFVEDMGQRKEGFSLERVDVDKGYSKGNCVWLPHNLQSKNRTDWKHTEAGIRAISDSRKQDWQNGVYTDKVAAQQIKGD
jgi:hypothetical protein